jgi:hypothetical protein
LLRRGEAATIAAVLAAEATMHPNRWLAILGLLAANGAAAQPVTIEGSVRSPFFGTGVAGATVTVQRVTDLLGGGPVVATVTTDAGGLYTATVDGGCGLQCRIRAAADGRVVTPDLRILSAGGGGPQDFVAALPAVLNVRVEEFDGGAPVAGLQPFARYVDPTQSPVVEDLGGGRWRFSGVFTGQLHLCACRRRCIRGHLQRGPGDAVHQRRVRAGAAVAGGGIHAGRGAAAAPRRDTDRHPDRQLSGDANPFDRLHAEAV